MITGHCSGDYHDSCPAEFNTCFCDCHTKVERIFDSLREWSRREASLNTAQAQWHKDGDHLV